MSKPAQKYKNNAVFKQNYAKKLKMVYPCCFGLRGNLDFSDFLQKKFYNINYWPLFVSVFLRTTNCKEFNRTFQ